MQSNLLNPVETRSAVFSLLFGTVLLLSTALLQPLQAQDALTRPDEGLVRIELQTCQLMCSRNLAECERERRRGVRCPRDYQFCRDDCAAARKPELTAAQRQERLCTQRCETSTALCEQESTRNDAECRAGLSQCVARC